MVKKKDTDLFLTKENTFSEDEHSVDDSTIDNVSITKQGREDT